MDEIETRKKLVEKAVKIGIPEGLLKNLTSISIRKILEHDEEVKGRQNGTREISGH
tara:strand:- start:313 stop:480 length:168 start_codon:yes stop_codon:yes gene_type:complete